MAEVTPFRNVQCHPVRREVWWHEAQRVAMDSRSGEGRGNVLGNKRQHIMYSNRKQCGRNAPWNQVW